MKIDTGKLKLFYNDSVIKTLIFNVPPKRKFHEVRNFALNPFSLGQYI